MFNKKITYQDLASAIKEMQEVLEGKGFVKEGKDAIKTIRQFASQEDKRIKRVGKIQTLINKRHSELIQQDKKDEARELNFLMLDAICEKWNDKYMLVLENLISKEGE